MTDRYAVIGNPISHSRSPDIHAAFARQTGQDMSYERILGPLDRFAATVDEFLAEGGRGLNVTLPFKLEAFVYARQHTPRAMAAGAVNTLRKDDGGILGDNTDGAGLVRDLEENLGKRLEGSRILLLGAGGAARGALLPLLAAKPAVVVIANRTPQKAVDLQRAFQSDGSLQVRGFADLAGERFNVVINATSASIGGSAPDLPAGIYGPDALAYDMMYGKGDTPFLEQARRAGVARTADGLGMLVEQAAEAFLLWRGIRPDTAPVLRALRG